MHFMKIKVLIISYIFPPSKEVGGRRWSKFAKSLNELGIEVHLITSNMGFEKNKVIEIPKYIASYKIIQNKYPEILNKTPKSIFNKIHYRTSLYKVKKISNGNYYDRGIYSEKELYSLVKEYLNNYDFEKVIVTGAPFSLLYYISKWKKEFNYFLVCDIRDPWTYGESYGIQMMSDLRKKEELRRESIVFHESDMITIPNKDMAEKYSILYPLQKHKIKVLLHGYDESEFENIENVSRIKNKWIYGGTLYPESYEIYKYVFNYLNNSKKIDLEIYSRNNLNFIKEYEKVKFYPIVSPKEFNLLCHNSSFFLWVFPEKFKDYLSTKLFELIRCRIPIIYIGYKGVFSKFIVENRLGVFIEVINYKKEINSVFDNLSKFEYNKNYPIEKYSTLNVIKTII